MPLTRKLSKSEARRREEEAELAARKAMREAEMRSALLSSQSLGGNIHWQLHVRSRIITPLRRRNRCAAPTVGVGSVRVGTMRRNARGGFALHSGLFSALESVGT